MVFLFTTLHKNAPYENLKAYSEDTFWQVNLDIFIIRKFYAYGKGF